MQFNAVTCCKHFMLLFVPSDPGKLQLKIYWHVGEGDKINRRQLQVPAFETLSTHISFARKQENTAKDFMARMIAKVKELLKVTVSVYITSLQQTGRTIDRSFSPGACHWSVPWHRTGCRVLFFLPTPAGSTRNVLCDISWSVFSDFHCFHDEAWLKIGIKLHIV